MCSLKDVLFFSKSKERYCCYTLLLLRFANDLEEYGKVEQLPVLEGKRMIIMLTPKKAGSAAASKPAVSKPVVKKVVVTPKPKTEESE